MKATQYTQHNLNTALFVPATQLSRIEKALATEADIVIVDLEDAVSASEKDKARAMLSDYLSQHAEQYVWVRVNSVLSAQCELDLSACSQHRNVLGVVLPNANSADEIDHVYQSTKKPIIPIIETVAGLQSLPSIAANAGVLALTYGILDLSIELGIEMTHPVCQAYLAPIRWQLLTISHHHKLLPPLDSVYLNFQDSQGLERHVRTIKVQGMGGMLCIHPKQVSIVKNAYRTKETEISWAKRVINIYERTGASAFQIDGKMVDLPVIKKAKLILGIGET